MNVDLHRLLSTTSAAQDEAEHRARWLAEAAGEDSPFAMAIAGGASASGFAGVFSAGYQTALRVTFPAVPFRGWAAFVVSEDVGETPLPGVTCAEDGHRVTLTGYKTWIAACDVVDELVVRATDVDGGLHYYLVPRETPGLEMTRKPQPSVLPELSQGAAHFDGVGLETAELDASRVKYFGIVEPFYIYVAFLSMAYQRLANEALRTTIHTTLEGAAGLDPITAPPRALAAFDDVVQNLRRGLVNLTDDLAWRADAKLIAMYSKAMQKRL